MGSGLFTTGWDLFLTVGIWVGGPFSGPIFSFSAVSGVAQEFWAMGLATADSRDGFSFSDIIDGPTPSMSDIG